MYPVLIEIGPYTIYSYGLFIALGLALGLWIWQDEARQQGLQANLLPGLALMPLFVWLLGARAAFLLQQPVLLAQNPEQFLYIWHGGLNVWAGVAPALLVLVLQLKIRRESLLKWGDALAFALASGLAVGYIGHFVSGVSYGKPTDFALAVAYTKLDSPAPLLVPLHPTQIYYSLAGVLVYTLLNLTRTKTNRPGQKLGLFLMLYFSLYCIISQLRGDGQPLLWGLLWQQWLAVLLALLGLWMYLRGKETRHA
ncbi:MAG: prolipoprotein diacylglyceryl transferase [Desulfohalobiaceae bacterium]